MNKDRQHRSRILYICYGNKCKIPKIIGIAKKILKGVAHVDSAGIAAWGSKASEEAIKVIKREFGIDISDHNPTNITYLLISNFNYIVTMDYYIDTFIRKGY